MESIELLPTWEKQRHQTKINKLNDLLKQNPSDTDTMRRKGEYLIRLGEITAGLEMIEQANLQDDLDFPEFVKNRALHQAKMKKFLGKN